MNCEDIREQLTETARGRELSSDIRALVFRHAAVCSDCATRLESERQLSSALEALAVHAGAAPARLEEILRQQLPIPIRRRSRPLWVWGGAVAAAFALAVGLYMVCFSGAFREMAPVGLRPVSSQNTASASQPNDHPALVSARSDSETADDGFVLLPFADDPEPNERAEIVRVQMGREMLLAMGVPVSPDNFSDQVQADVLLGMDGTARAIRVAD